MLGLLVAMLALSKRNYLAFLAMLPAVIAVARLGAASAALLACSALAGAAWFLGWLPADPLQAGTAAAVALIALLAAVFADPARRRDRARVVVKFAAMGAVAVAAAVPRIAWDVVTHGSLEEKRLAMGAVQEEMARPGYKPSEVYSGKPDAGFYGMNLRAKGTSLGEIFEPPWNWHTKTFFSGTGQYGWLEFSSPKAWYALIALAYAALFATYLRAVIRSGEAVARWDFAFAVAFAALAVGVAIHHSWVNDFQAQGRYLFPIVAMAGVGFHAARREMASRATLLVVVTCFALSVWSFVFTGLAHVPRHF
jgi:hypothetical protein